MELDETTDSSIAYNVDTPKWAILWKARYHADTGGIVVA